LYSVTTPLRAAFVVEFLMFVNAAPPVACVLLTRIWSAEKYE